MAFEGEVEGNLKALLREDQSVSDILDSANPVAVYIFNDESKEWENIEMEGTIFVHKRFDIMHRPTFGFTIMNQESLDNWSQTLYPGLEFLEYSPFLVTRNTKSMGFGLKFENMVDCRRMGYLLNE
ncbi:unnamed protein product [Clavelina lepadiformis]|uniref:5'-(N(7)-methylguanosine 5'-triphospho)-[mRNA] hydrolase n=1 Tax=Clavelina lepadiformis TaxID=159417 RepID=A0ABP0EZU5_CLALP